jgi:FtsP/CotA-like multicopper oxidase with cupredoxin domain
MVRIGLMSNKIWAANRREFLAGMGLAMLGATPAAKAAAAPTQSLLLRAKPGSLLLRPGQVETPIWSLEAPSPVLRFKRGSELEIALQNDLPSPVALNWHGLDGVGAMAALTAQLPVPAGASTRFKAFFHHAGTLFGDLGLLAQASALPTRVMPLIVEETEFQQVDRDEVFLIEDFRLRPDGKAIGAGSDPGEAAAIYTVNGLISPDIAVHSNERLRLRFINACQRYVIAVKIDGLDARVMALDSQPAEPFLARNGAVLLAPGGRADAFVDVTLPSGSTPQVLLHDGKDARPIARLRVEGEIARSSPLASPASLPSNGLPEQLELKSAHRFELALVGKEWVTPLRFSTSIAPAFKVRKGRIVVLALVNRASVATVFHLHGHHFRLLDRLDDGWKPYWLDTIAIEPGQTQRIAFAAETVGRWLIESTAVNWAAPRLVRWYSVE